MKGKYPLTLGRSDKSPQKKKSGSDKLWSKKRRTEEKHTAKKLKNIGRYNLYLHVDGNLYYKQGEKILPLEGISEEYYERSSSFIKSGKKHHHLKKKKDWSKIREIGKDKPVRFYEKIDDEVSLYRRPKKTKKISKSNSSSSSLPPDLEPMEMITYLPPSPKKKKSRGPPSASEAKRVARARGRAAAGIKSKSK